MKESNSPREVVYKGKLLHDGNMSRVVYINLLLLIPFFITGLLKLKILAWLLIAAFGLFLPACAVFILWPNSRNYVGFSPDGVTLYKRRKKTVIPTEKSNSFFMVIMTLPASTRGLASPSQLANRRPF